MGKSAGLFRQQALERFSSPERLDQLVQLTAPKEWVALAALAALVGAALVWSVAGSLPTTVAGSGVIVLSGSSSPERNQSAGASPGAGEVEQADRKLWGVLYFDVQAGKRIRPGMPVLVTPETAERERFGGMLATVETVSDLPVTRDQAAALVGSRELVDHLLAAGPQIQVGVVFQPDRSAPSGYRWSSSPGPSLAITAGTTAAARVVVETRAPITYLLPFLRSASGIY